MMGKLVDHHMGDELTKGDVATLGPFVEDRTTEQPDSVGPVRDIHHRFFGERNAVIQAREFKRVLDQRRVGLDRIDRGNPQARNR